jgi:Penicillin-insensitive murein endopeptidase
VRQSQFRSVLVAAIALGTATAGNVGAAEPGGGAISLGYPNAGRLVDGRQFHSTPYMVTVPSHANSRVRWALPGLLSVVARRFPGSVLEIGELSRHDGGPIASHLSHQNGRDADVGFYLVDLDGEPVRAETFLRCYGSGDGRDDPTVRFDEKRNWAFVRAVLEDTHYEVRQIFIYAPLRARLLAYAAKIGAPHDLRAKAAAAMMQPANALPHDDHFHIRISCPADQIEAGCSDLPLWRAPGSPDEFGPELLATAPSPRRVRNAFPPEDWGRLSRLWSTERAVCDRDGLWCSGEDEAPACENLGDLGSPWMPPLAEELTLAQARVSAPPDLEWKFLGGAEEHLTRKVADKALAESNPQPSKLLEGTLRLGEAQTSLPTTGSGIWVGPADDLQGLLARYGSAPRGRALVLEALDLRDDPIITIAAKATPTAEEVAFPDTSPPTWVHVVEEPLN